MERVLCHFRHGGQSGSQAKVGPRPRELLS